MIIKAIVITIISAEMQKHSGAWDENILAAVIPRVKGDGQISLRFKRPAAAVDSANW